MRRTLTTRLLVAIGVSPLLALMCKTDPKHAPPDATAGARNDDADADGPAESAGGAGMAPAVGSGAVGGDYVDRSWLTSEANWREVAAAAFTLPTCTILEAVDPTVGFPALDWSACGDACETADVGQDRGSSAGLPRASTVRTGDSGGALLALSYSYQIDQRLLSVRRVFDLESGRSVAALKADASASLTTSPCSFAGPVESAAVVNVVGGNQGDAAGESSTLYGFASLEDGSWVWAAPATPLAAALPARMSLDIDEPMPLLLLLGAGTVYKQQVSTSSAFEILERPSTAFLGAGEGDLAIWTDLASPDATLVRGWAGDGKGVRTILATPPQTSCLLALSPSAAVGLAMEGRPALFHSCSGPVDACHFWRSPRAYTDGEGTVQEGRPLVGPPFVVGGLRTWGDYVGAYVRPVTYLETDYQFEGDPYIIVARTSTWQSWKVSATEDRVIQSTSWTLTDKFLYFGETERDANHAMLMTRAVRIPLETLDEFGTPL